MRVDPYPAPNLDALQATLIERGRVLRARLRASALRIEQCRERCRQAEQRIAELALLRAQMGVGGGNAAGERSARSARRSGTGGAAQLQLSVERYVSAEIWLDQACQYAMTAMDAWLDVIEVWADAAPAP